MSVPVRSRHSRRRLSGSFSPAASAWRRRGRAGRSESQQAPEDTWRARDDRRVVAFCQKGQKRRIGAGFQNKGGGPHGPGVHEAGAKGIGPVERPGMKHPVICRKSVPAIEHHGARQDSAVRMLHAHWRSGSAGSEDDIGRAVAWRTDGGVQRLVRAQFSRRYAGDIVFWQGDAWLGNDQRRLQNPGDLGDLGDTKCRRGWDGHKARGNGPKMGDGKVRRVAKAEENSCACWQTECTKACGSFHNGASQTAIAPPFGPRRPKKDKRHLVIRCLPREQHMLGQIHACRNVRAGAKVFDCQHAPDVSGGRQSASLGLSGGDERRHLVVGHQQRQFIKLARFAESQVIGARQMAQQSFFIQRFVGISLSSVAGNLAVITSLSFAQFRALVVLVMIVLRRPRTLARGS